MLKSIWKDEFHESLIFIPRLSEGNGTHGARPSNESGLSLLGNRPSSCATSIDAGIPSRSTNGLPRYGSASAQVPDALRPLPVAFQVPPMGDRLVTVKVTLPAGCTVPLEESFSRSSVSQVPS